MIDGQLDADLEAARDGSVEDWAAYRRLCGWIAGARYVLEAVAESAKPARARPVAALDNDARRTPGAPPIVFAKHRARKKHNVGNDGVCSHKMADRSEDRRGPRGNPGEVPAGIHATDERGLKRARRIDALTTVYDPQPTFA